MSQAWSHRVVLQEQGTCDTQHCILQALASREWRDGWLSGQNICCSSRGPKFSSQHLHGATHSHLVPALRDPASFGSLRLACAHTHTTVQKQFENAFLFFWFYTLLWHSSLASFEACLHVALAGHVKCLKRLLHAGPVLSTVYTQGVGSLDLFVTGWVLAPLTGLSISVSFPQSVHSNLLSSDLNRNLSFQPRIILTQKLLQATQTIFMIPGNFESLIQCLFSSR